jgi:ParB-like chromosome segregation protein Spo0J
MVNIESVLALLPELFPGIQEIPLGNIRPNPNNPGPALTEQEVAELADNLADRGLVNPIKVRPDRANPLAEGVQPHPDNPRLTIQNRPWRLEDFRFMIMAGERRWRAAGRLKWATVKAFILNPTEEEAVEITHLDNDVRDRGWWAGYQSIEQLIQANPGLTLRQVATKLKMHLSKVSQALRLLSLLNPASRDLIVRNSNNSNKGIWGISESAALRLADLGPGSGLKRGVRKKESAEGTGSSAQGEPQVLWPYPAIPSETKDLVRQTLEKAFEMELTEAGLKGLVRFVQEGHRPEEYKGTPEGQLGVKSEKLGVEKSEPEETGEEDEDDSKPIPWSENVKNPEYREIPVSRVRVSSTLADYYAQPLFGQRTAAAMKANGFANHILVRSLSEAERASDPEHDYELFNEPETLKGARILGWPTLHATIYAIDEWEAIRLLNTFKQVTPVKAWIDIYSPIEKMVREGSQKTLAEWAIALEEDRELFERVIPAMKLLNASARDAIRQSVLRCYKKGEYLGGYEFSPETAVLLEPLKDAFPDLLKTQKLVEKVVLYAIEHEMDEEDLADLVDWALAGNDPNEFYEVAG